VFWDQAVITETEGDPGAPVDAREDVESALAALQARELVFERYGSAFAGSREFIFKHALLRDVTYESVLKRLRRKYHRAVADWLAAQPEAESRAAMIARHYEDGEEHGKCAAWYATAVTQARLRYANTDAVAYYRRALERGELPPAQQVPLYDGLGEVLMLQAEYDAALEAWLSMRAAAEAGGDVRSQASALTGTSFVHSRLGATREALEAAKAAEALLLGLPDPAPGDLADALNAAGWASFRLADLPDAQRRAEEARVLAAQAGDRRGVSRSLNLLSLVESMRGDHAAAVAHMEEGLAIDRKRADRRAEGASLINLGEAARMLGDYEHAAARYSEALVIQRELGDRDMEALSLSNLGGAQLGLGEYEEALQKLEPALEAFEGAGASENLSETYRFLAEAHLGLGDPDTAIGFVQRALATAVAAGNPEQTGHAWRIIGLIAGRTGRSVASEADGPVGVEAGDAFDRSVSTFEEAALDRDRAVALADWAVWERRVGEPHARERMGEARRVLSGLRLGRLEAQVAAAFDAAERAEG
jgi:tetratricopeptide (TPR) repeat protein